MLVMSEDGIIGVVIREENGVSPSRQLLPTLMVPSVQPRRVTECIRPTDCSGSSLGEIDEYAVMGHYLFYGKGGEKSH